MANGRLQSTTIPAYGAAEIYNNNSGSQASVTIHGQVISETANSKLSVAATTCDYSTTIVTSSTCSSCTVGPYDCLLAISYCDVIAETYNGYSMNTGTNICLSSYTPAYVNASGSVQSCKPYAVTHTACRSASPCCWASCFTNYGMQYTLVHPKILSKYGKGRFVAANYICNGTSSCLIMSCYGCHTDEVNLKLSACAQSVAGCFTHASNGEVIPYTASGETVPTQWYIDLWTDQTFMIGHFRRQPGANQSFWLCACDCVYVMSNCPRTMTPGCVTRNDHAVNAAIVNCGFNICHYTWTYLTCYAEHFSKGPMNGGGCDVYFQQYAQAIHTCGSCAFWLKSLACIKTASINDLNCCWGIISKLCVCCQYESATCSCGRPVFVYYDPGESEARYGIKWFAWNPIKKCHYFMIYNGGSDDGIYSVDHATLGKCAQGYLTAGTGLHNWPHTLSDGPFTKISSVPSAYTSFGGPGVMCYGRLYHADFCYYTIPVHNGTNWATFASQDLITWSNSRDDSTCCFVQLTESQNRTFVSSGGSGICQVSNNFDTCINVAGMIDYRVEANQYQQNGVVVSNGDRLYVKNTGSNPVAFNVWGYEG